MAIMSTEPASQILIFYSRFFIFLTDCCLGIPYGKYRTIILNPDVTYRERLDVTLVPAAKSQSLTLSFRAICPPLDTLAYPDYY